jgi:hypothetical protein
MTRSSDSITASVFDKNVLAAIEIVAERFDRNAAGGACDLFDAPFF